MTSSYLLVEIAGGLYFHSLALISDAAHMLTDVAALAIALIAIKVGNKAPDSKRTFGYRRFEILAAAFNSLLLFAIGIYVLVEAIIRLRKPEPIGSTGMLLIALVGLAVNLISMRLLAAGQKQSFNVKGAYLEVWADMIGSLGVIAGAIVIRFTDWRWIDPVVAIGIGLWVLPRTWVLLRDTGNVLLEGVPGDINLAELRQKIAGINGVAAVHDLHVWSMSNEDLSCTAHVSVPTGSDGEKTRNAVTSMLKEQFGIEHCTIQVEAETEPCPQRTNQHP